MTDYIDTAQARALASAADDLSYWYRLAEGGETCYLCGRELAAGEMYDRLFVVACMDCMDEIDERNRLKNEEHENESV